MLSLVVVLASIAGQAEAPAPAAGPSGGVATAVTIPDDNPALRAVAAGALAAAGERWGLLVPPLRPEAAEVCQAEIRCLLNLASDRGASHLLVLGVATLSEDEVVVSMQLFATENSTEVMSFTDVVALEHDPFGTGRRLAEGQIADVEGVPGPGEVEPRWPPPPPPEVQRYLGFSWLSIAGWSVVGVGAATGLAGLGVGLVQSTGAVPGLPPESRNVTALVVAPLVVGLVGAGLAVVVADLFVQGR